MSRESYYKAAPQVLSVERYLQLRNNSMEDARAYVYLFDFEFRTLTVVSRVGSTHEQTNVVPFSTVDAEVLEKMRDKLVELGGRPDELSAKTHKPGLPHPRVKGLNP